MTPEQRIAFLERQVSALERERSAALDALELASSLGSFETAYSQNPDQTPILEEICRRATVMLPFRSTSVYLIDDETQDLGTTHHAAPDHADEANAEVEELIRDQSFAFAIQTERPCFFRCARGGEGQVMLHAIATPTRMRGMFVGLLEHSVEHVPDTTLSLFPVVMQAGAHALESYELGRQFHEHRRHLDRLVRERTALLEEANATLHTILDNLPAGVLVVDAETHAIADMNPAGLRMIGAEKSQVVGRKCFRFVCPTHEGRCPMARDGDTLELAERTLLTVDGGTVPILKTVARTTLGGKPHLVEIFVDITEQKKLERLREDIERITRHDLKTPLNGIINIPESLLGSLDLKEHDRELLKAVKESGLKMLRLINISLDLYKMEVGGYQYQPVTVDLIPLIDGVLRELENWSHAKRLEVRLLRGGRPSAAREPFLVRGEELLLYSMLANLVKNAMEACGMGGVVTIDLDDGPPPTVTIHNPGVVPAEVRGQFFEKYATHGKSQGTGLGTYSARLMARTMGGDITLETGEERGTLLRVTLP
jgi:PAS domain S-box-containing protein